MAALKLELLHRHTVSVRGRKRVGVREDCGHKETILHGRDGGAGGGGGGAAMMEHHLILSA